MSKIVAIIQARTGSTRLPKKVLEKIAGKPMLWHVIDRVKNTKLVNEVVLATTSEEEDNPLLKLAEKSGVRGYVGSGDDVLDRYFQAATKFDADVIVRITADCPLIDSEITDKVIKCFLEDDFDYVSNTVKLSYPDGLDVEVFSYDALKKAWKKAKKSSEREHVTPYIKNHPELFKIGSVGHERDLSHMRWCVDTERDLRFVREVYKQLYKKGEIFLMKDVLELLEKHPELMEINKGVTRNEGYFKSLKEEKPLNDRGLR
ncbi:MAG: cytidylyltransferase domain-containing protein [Candidatus Hadarchaeaceae archaeon]